MDGSKKLVHLKGNNILHYMIKLTILRILWTNSYNPQCPTRRTQKHQSKIWKHKLDSWLNKLQINRGPRLSNKPQILEQPPNIKVVFDE